MDNIDSCLDNLIENSTSYSLAAKIAEVEPYFEKIEIANKEKKISYKVIFEKLKEMGKSEGKFNYSEEDFNKVLWMIKTKRSGKGFAKKNVSLEKSSPEETEEDDMPDSLQEVVQEVMEEDLDQSEDVLETEEQTAAFPSVSQIMESPEWNGDSLNLWRVEEIPWDYLYIPKDALHNIYERSSYEVIDLVAYNYYRWYGMRKQLSDLPEGESIYLNLKSKVHATYFKNTKQYELPVILEKMEEIYKNNRGRDE